MNEGVGKEKGPVRVVLYHMVKASGIYILWIAGKLCFKQEWT